MVAERTVVGYFVEGAGSLFPDFKSAQEWRSAQIWDGGIGMTPEPEAVYAPVLAEETPALSEGAWGSTCGICGCHDWGHAEGCPAHPGGAA